MSDLVAGLKRDEQKVSPTLVHPEIMEALAWVFQYGLDKYHKGSWMEFTADEARAVLPDAAQRHFNEWLKGNKVSPEKLPHLVQAAWNLLVLHWHENHEQPEPKKPSCRDCITKTFCLVACPEVSAELDRIDTEYYQKHK